MNALVPRATIEDVVALRNEAIALYEVAFEKIEEAHEALKAARETAERCHPGALSYAHERTDEIREFEEAVKLPRRDRYLRTAKRLTDIRAWSWIIQRTELEKLMDHQAKEQLRAQMRFVPERANRDGEVINADEIAKGLPELSVENVMATLERFREESGMIFQRGIANVFSKLDRRFRSHDGFKIGSRIVLTHCFSEWGGLRHGATRDILIDVERVFAILDGHPESSFTSAIDALEASRQGGGLKPRQSECETPYFKIKGFKNGNAHLWLKRDDLVEQVNKILAGYYGEVIGDARQAEDDPLKNVKATPARRYGFFPTPEAAAARLLDEAPLLRLKSQERLRVLEPSAGTGNLARLCVRRLDDFAYARERFEREYRFDNQVDCVEIQGHLADALTAEGIYNRVWHADFLALKPEDTGLYDLIVMNPPFDGERDIDHVHHALSFLKPEGQLHAIMSAGVEFRETRKAVAFRRLVIDQLNGSLRDMPLASFAESGTNVSTVILRVKKNGRQIL